ncbi:MAG: molybdopterin-dependent oxidoreductase [Acidimicrobiia bacterium]|nr:molybdopterin-dependent oxidoreductase [Acidimicrobiia bacterium]
MTDPSHQGGTEMARGVAATSLDPGSNWASSLDELGAPPDDESTGTTRHSTLTNWGAYEIVTDGHDLIAIDPFAKDPDPSAIGQSMKAVRRSRVERPAIRRSWFREGPGANRNDRGREPFVEVEWDVALDLLATELKRVRSTYGNQAIFGGSYGWASAGRFHHATGQIHRFLNTIGGYTYSVDDYSIGAGRVITPHIFGFSLDDFMNTQPRFEEIADNTELVVSFGGLAIKNSQINAGGVGRHMFTASLSTCRDRGVRFVNVSPVRADVSEPVDAEWVPLRPSTDTALMLGLAHSLLVASDHNEAFLENHCSGWDHFRSYLLGELDNTPKSANWAGEISGVKPGRIRALAAEMAAVRTLISVSWSVQRTDHGEQTYWAASALAAMLGQIGLKGGGIGFGYGAVAPIGQGAGHHPLPHLPQGENEVTSFIPVARISDMLLHEGEMFHYNGQRFTYPTIRLVYWAGGNPFHHHQDLNRLERAWQRPDTIVCHEPFWNSHARHADIVLPATTPLERYDVGGSTTDDFVFWMDKVIDPVGEAKNDYDIFTDLARRLSASERFTEGRTSDEWIKHIYDRFHSDHPDFPPLGELREHGYFEIPLEWVPPTPSPLTAFREDPIGSALQTPSGRIELYSETIAGFGYPDCPPHPSWLEPQEWLGTVDRYPLHLISNQPKTRLHSQWDHGETSLNGKVDGREQIGMASPDAHARGLAHGDLVRVFNDRGETLAAVAIRNDLMEGVVQLPTGAWWDPIEPGGLCRAGNPNVLTRDAGTSSLAQGSTAQTCLVEVDRFDGEPPPVRAHEHPAFVVM